LNQNSQFPNTVCRLM